MMAKAGRIILGVFLIIMGLNKFFPFLPTMEMTEPAAQFIAALTATGYMIPLIGIVEMVCGALILFYATAPLGILLLAPHSINVILFHLFLDPANGLFATLVFLGNLALGIYYFDYYRSVFARILSERVIIKDKNPQRKAGPAILATVN